jgi:hypothetical protein
LQNPIFILTIDSTQQCQKRTTKWSNLEKKSCPYLRELFCILLSYLLILLLQHVKRKMKKKIQITPHALLILSRFNHSTLERLPKHFGRGNADQYPMLNTLT